MSQTKNHDKWARLLSVIALIVAGGALYLQLRSTAVQEAQFEASLTPQITIWAGQSPDPDTAHAVGVRNTGAANLRDVRIVPIFYTVCADSLEMVSSVESIKGWALEELQVGESVTLTSEIIEPTSLSEFLEIKRLMCSAVVGLLAIRVKCRRVADLEEFEFVSYYFISQSGEIERAVDKGIVVAIFKRYVSAIERWESARTLE